MATVVLRALPAKLALQRGDVGFTRRVCVPGWPHDHNMALKEKHYWWDPDIGAWWNTLEGPETVEELQARREGLLQALEP
jgi:hypothetical protein